MVFFELQRDPWVYSRVSAGWSFKIRVVHRCQDSCLVTRDTSGISMRLGTALCMLLEVRRETKGPFLVATVIF